MTEEIPLRISGGQDLIEMVPHMLRFHPTNSLIVMGFVGGNRKRLGPTLRVGLPERDDWLTLLGWSLHITDTLRAQTSIGGPDGPETLVGIATIVVSDEPPPENVAETVAEMHNIVEVDDLLNAHTTGFTPGSTWTCYCDSDQCNGGVLPDRTSVVQAELALRGHAAPSPDRSAWEQAGSPGGWWDGQPTGSDANERGR